MDTPSDATEVYYNPKIYDSPTDYLLGGFLLGDLDKIIVKGDSGRISIRKIKLIVEERLRIAIEEYKDGIRLSILKNKELADDETDEEQAINDNLVNMLETYLGISPLEEGGTDMWLELILNSNPFSNWFDKIEQNFNNAQTAAIQETVQGKLTDSKTGLTKEDADDFTGSATLESMLEALGSINQSILQ